MTPHELIAEIQKLTPREQQQILETFSSGIGAKLTETGQISEDEVEHRLFELGVIGDVPDPSAYAEEDEDFDPIDVPGKPLSETIIEERR